MFARVLRTVRRRPWRGILVSEEAGWYDSPDESCHTLYDGGLDGGMEFWWDTEVWYELPGDWTAGVAW